MPPPKNETDEQRRARLDILKAKRAAESNEQSHRKQNDAARKRLKRSNESQEETAARQKNDATRKQLNRSNESQAATAARQQKNAQGNRDRIANEPQEETVARRQKNAQGNRDRIANESQEETASRQQKDAQGHRDRIANESQGETAARKQKDAQGHRDRIANESADQAVLRRQAADENKRQAEKRRQQKSKQEAMAWKENENLIKEHSCNKMEKICTACGSLNFKDELPRGSTVTRCCSKGKVELPSFKSYPDILEKLMKNEHPESKNFQENVRSINCSLGFASMGANLAPPGGHGPYCFRLHGTVYHRTGTLHPPDGEQKKFAQLYILDAAEATKERLNISENRGCSESLMLELAELMQEINPYTASYKMLHEIEQQQPDSNVAMVLIRDNKDDQRRYNDQRVSEVAVVFTSEDGAPPYEREIKIYLREGDNQPKIQTISILNENLDPMTYPILFPHGDPGWTLGMLLQGTGTVENETNERKRKTVSMMQYFSYRLSVRADFNPLLNAGRLTQQYIVDAYAKMESDRLNYIRTHQNNLRVENYQSLLRHAQSDEASVPGRRVILPSSFNGSPRNMQQRYQDAMTIVTKFGKPDLFITMTCNPKWDDIVNELTPWQKAENRPDLVARVFKIKLKALIVDIKGGCFGKLKAMIHVIEFQKRGLPHAHILIILDEESKLLTTDAIDEVVCAEIPDKDKYPRLHAIVMKNMVHGPCGKINPNSPCMDGHKCTKKFPREFSDKTFAENNGYPLYKRRDGPFEIVKKGNTDHRIDNSWIVPYNPFLLLKYNCHINVEICATIKSVKYLYKYVYKGHDCAKVSITESNTNDEVRQFLDTRYVSAPEAIWRIFAFNMFEQSHVIKRLDVHLPNEQNVYFNPDEIEAGLNRADNKVTTLMAWFRLNHQDIAARQYYYWQIPEHYVFEKNYWKPRKIGTSIGRMYNYGFKDPELYFLRLLLLNVKGATSYEALRTVEGIEYATFREAAVKYGLMLDDTVWEKTLEEAVTCNMPYQLRQLFAYICVLGGVLDTKALWKKYLEYFVEDICHTRHEIDEMCNGCADVALRDIQETLIIHGKKCEDFGLPTPQLNLPGIAPLRDAEEAREKAEQRIQTLNPQQLAAFNAIINAVNDDSVATKAFFLDGVGGSGKTYLYETLDDYVTGQGGTVLIAATTGIAANLLQGGRTVHSMYKIPLQLNESSVSGMKPNSQEADRIRQAQLLLIDESTMMSKYCLNVIDTLLREIMGVNLPFGGKVFVLGGDFRQCLAIVPHASESEIVQTCIRYAKAWDSIKRLSLVENMRSEDPEYSNWLLQLGNGKLSNNDSLGQDVIEVPEDLIATESIVHHIFGDLNAGNTESMSKRAILCPKNDDVDRINSEVLQILNTEGRKYVSSDSVDCDDPTESENFPTEYLNSITPSGMPHHTLELKIGAIIMLLRNLNTRRGLCNGTRLVVQAMMDHIIVAKVLTGTAKGQVVLIPRIDLTSANGELPFQLRRRQFPVRLAFAMTINKAQGQTLEKVGIFLRESVFSHGQLYVAFSRVRRRSDVKIQICQSSEQGKLIEDSEKVFTRNVVFRQVL